MFRSRIIISKIIDSCRVSSSGVILLNSKITMRRNSVKTNKDVRIQKAILIIWTTCYYDKSFFSLFYVNGIFDSITN